MQCRGRPLAARAQDSIREVYSLRGAGGGFDLRGQLSSCVGELRTTSLLVMGSFGIVCLGDLRSFWQILITFFVFYVHDEGQNWKFV